MTAGLVGDARAAVRLRTGPASVPFAYGGHCRGVGASGHCRACRVSALHVPKIISDLVLGSNTILLYDAGWRRRRVWAYGELHFEMAANRGTSS